MVDAALSGDKDYSIWDSAVSGFGLKITPKGRKVYILQYRLGGRQFSTRRSTIGRHGFPWTVDTALERARHILQEVRQGIYPAKARQADLQTRLGNPFDEYLVRYLELYGRKSWGPRTYISVESTLRIGTKDCPAEAVLAQAIRAVSDVNAPSVFRRKHDSEHTSGQGLI